jgi:aminoglycoside phosphotransferase (APT) family kinase protein
MMLPEHIVSRKLLDRHELGESNNKVCKFSYRKKQYYAKIYNEKVCFQRETYALENFGGADIPVPQIVFKSAAFGTDESCLVVTEQIKGTTLDDIQRQRNKYCYQAGRMLSRIHSLKVAAVASPLVIPGEEIARQLNHFADEENIRHPLLQAIEKTLAELDSSYQGVMSHGDFIGRHILVSRGTISGIIDWENLRTARPEFDLGYSRALLELVGSPEEEHSFVKGYGLPFDENLTCKLKFFYKALFASHWKREGKMERYQQAVSSIKAHPA